MGAGPNSLSVSHSVIGETDWGFEETARLQFPMQAAGVVEAKLTHGTEGHCMCVCVWGGMSACTWGVLGTSY